MNAVIRCPEREAGATSAWYLLQIKTQQYLRAQQNLQNQGFEYYSPMHKVNKLYRRQYISREEPLFPGYMFVRLDKGSDWQGLQSTKGVTRVVSFNGRPQPVADELIHGLKQRFDNDQTPEALYNPGDKVMITDGCFKHLEAIVQAVTADARIIVLLNLLNRQQTLTMDPAYLQK